MSRAASYVASRSLLALLALVPACSSSDQPVPARVASSGAALSQVGLRPIPADGGVPVWGGGDVDLLIADAMATCIPDAQVTSGNFFGLEDEYLGAVWQHMLAAQCVTNGPPGPAQPMAKWRAQRNDPDCNVIPGTTGTKDVIDLGNPQVISYPTGGFGGACEVAFALDPNNPNSVSLANVCEEGAEESALAAIQRPARNLCIAQKIREAIPGTAAAFGLWMDSPELRKLVDVGRRMAQHAVLEYAKLGLVFTSTSTWEPDGPSPALIQVESEQFLYLVKVWGTEHSDEVEKIADDFAAATQLLTYFLEDEASLLHRDLWARTARGPTGDTEADADWGPGAWSQRYRAALHGGRVLAIDTENDDVTPWKTGTGKAEPGQSWSLSGKLAQPLRWPSDEESPYAEVRLDQPEVMQLDELLRRYDLLTFELEADTAVSEHPFATVAEAKTCRVIQDADADALSLYQRAELAHRNRTETKDPPWVLGDLSALADYRLRTQQGISLEHAETYLRFMSSAIGRICPPPSSRFTTSMIDGNISGTFAGGNLESIHLSADVQLRQPDVAQVAPEYAKFARMRMPSDVSLDVDARDYEFPVVPASGGWPDARSKQIMTAEGVLGTNAALTATRFALIRATRNMNGVEHPFLRHAADMVELIDATVGAESIVLRPKVSSNLLTRIGNGARCSGASCFGTFIDAKSLKQSVAGGDPQWELDVTVQEDDPFWTVSPQAEWPNHYEIYTIPNNALAGRLARFPSRSQQLSQGVPATMATLLQSLPATQKSTFDQMNLPLAISPLGDARTAHAILKTPDGANGTDHSWTVIVGRRPAPGQAASAFRVLVDGFKFWSNAVGLVPIGHYHSFAGTAGHAEARAMATQPRNPSLAAFDAFGFGRDRSPPLNPDLYLGSGAPDAASHWIGRSKEAAKQATAAVADAVDALIDQQLDQAILVAEQAKAAELQKLEDEALCGQSGAACNVATVVAPVSSVNVMFPTGYPDACQAAGTVQWPACPTEDNPTLQSPSSLLIDCGARAVFDLARRNVVLAEEVYEHLGDATVPPFQEYAGGELQALFIDQWGAARRLQQQVDLLLAQRQQAVSMNNEAYALYCASDAGVQLAEEAADCTFEVVMSTIAGVAAVAGSVVVTGFTAGAAAPAGVVGVAGGIAVVANAATAAEKCAQKDLEVIGAKSASAAAAAHGTTVFFQAMIGFRQQAMDIMATMVDLNASSANIEKLAAEVKRSKARLQLEAELAKNGAATSFGLYRRYHHFDLWRAYALAEDARRYASLARKAVDSRYVVDLAAMTKGEPLVAAPSTWSRSIYGYDFSVVNTVGLEVSDPTGDGLHPNLLVDYVGNLERFADGFPIDRPSAAAQEDTSVVSLDGPTSTRSVSWLDENGVTLETSEVPSVRAMQWQYLCDGVWRSPMPDEDGSTTFDVVDPETVCGGSAPHPTRARVGFALDPWGRLGSSMSEFLEPKFQKRYNARWSRLAVNLVGTAIRDCAKASDPIDCYANPFVFGHLRHIGPSWVPNYDGQMRLHDYPRGNIEGLKALAAEQWLDPVSNSWAKSYVTDIARTELHERALNGFYWLELDVTPDVRLDRIERVQLLVGTQYWVKQEWE